MCIKYYHDVTQKKTFCKFLSNVGKLIDILITYITDYYRQCIIGDNTCRDTQVYSTYNNSMVLVQPTYKFCCKHKSVSTPSMFRGLEYNNKKTCLYYTENNMAVPDDACVNGCCLHRNKKFYDDVSNLPLEYKLRIFEHLRP